MKSALSIRVQHMMKEARTRLALSQSSVAKCLGISKRQYSKLENGIVMISLSHWITFCRLLELDYNCIFFNGSLDHSPTSYLQNSDKGLAPGDPNRSNLLRPVG